MLSGLEITCLILFRKNLTADMRDNLLILLAEASAPRVFLALPSAIGQFSLPYAGAFKALQFEQDQHAAALHVWYMMVTTR